MPSSDYANTVGGGLKIKGGGVTKKKKKKPKPQPSPEADDLTTITKPKETCESPPANPEKPPTDEEKKQEVDSMSKKQDGKTEAQRRHEERRRKRVRSSPLSPPTHYLIYRSDFANLTTQLDERLKREGLKTHKERVEELNKYLSNLSEHHDMPRIGPG